MRSLEGRPAAGLGQGWRAFTAAVRLGWLTEANWTDPLLFIVYSVAKPLASALMLVVMLQVVSGGGAGSYLGFVVVGSALWAFVQSGIGGLSRGLLDDRERYRMLKYLYLSPSAFPLLLIGRGVALLATGAMGMLVVLAVGIVALGVPFDPGRVHWSLLVVVMILGVLTIVAVGLLMAAVVMQTRQESWSYHEAVAGALFLVVGAVFPLAVLPAPVQALGLLVPLTWWIAGVRAALFPTAVSAVGGQGSLFTALTGQAAPTDPQIVGLLLVTGLLVTLVAAASFRRSERRAKDRGLIDRTTGS
ncbi:MAG TPA: ABC transporter permease [Candidatus Limnocylindrales bacterium]|nr:ABC transporter permease [Candidatus Limnocylindrales bacterium]